MAHFPSHHAPRWDFIRTESQEHRNRRVAAESQHAKIDQGRQVTNNGGLWWPEQRFMDQVVPSQLTDPNSFDTANYRYQIYARQPTQCPLKDLSEATDEPAPLRYNVKRIAVDKPCGFRTAQPCHHNDLAVSAPRGVELPPLAKTQFCCGKTPFPVGKNGCGSRSQPQQKAPMLCNENVRWHHVLNGGSDAMSSRSASSFSSCGGGSSSTCSQNDYGECTNNNNNNNNSNNNNIKNDNNNNSNSNHHYKQNHQQQWQRNGKTDVTVTMAMETSMEDILMDGGASTSSNSNNNCSRSNTAGDTMMDAAAGYHYPRAGQDNLTCQNNNVCSFGCSRGNGAPTPNPNPPPVDSVDYTIPVGGFQKNRSNNNSSSRNENKSKSVGRTTTSTTQGPGRDNKQYPLEVVRTYTDPNCVAPSSCVGREKNPSVFLCRPKNKWPQFPVNRELPGERINEGVDEDQKHVVCHRVFRCDSANTPANAHLDAVDPLVVCRRYPPGHPGKPFKPGYGTYKIIGSRQYREPQQANIVDTMALPEHLDKYRAYLRRCPNVNRGRFDKADSMYQMLLPGSRPSTMVPAYRNPFMYARNPYRN